MGEWELTIIPLSENHSAEAMISTDQQTIE
jgi:hypothetical protein